jgi:hypothetical protein
MRPAEVPEPGLAEVVDAASPEGAAAPADSPAKPERDAEIERLQGRLDELRARIRTALPEGYDLSELVKASGDRHETEEVFEITSEIDALVNLAGPLNVPGMTPQPAFDTARYIEPLADEDTELASASASSRWKWLVLTIVLIAVIAGGLALVLTNL